MVDFKDMVRQANDLRSQANQESDPRIRDRLHRMADVYSHIAETDAGRAPASVHGLMDALTQRDKAQPSHDLPEPPDADSMKQTNEPWKQPIEKEQHPGKLSPEDLERWQKTNTH
jgi:hypothetical protein